MKLKIVGMTGLVIFIIGTGIFAFSGQTTIKNVQTAPLSITGYWGLIQENSNTKFETALEQCNIQEDDLPYRTIVNITDKIINFSNKHYEGNTTIEKISSVFEFCNEVTYADFEGWRQAQEVLDTRSGDCTDKAVLLVAMLEAQDIESYVVYGKDKPFGNRHAWVAARVDEHWIQLDPTTGGIFQAEECIDIGCANAYYYNIDGMFNSEISFKCEN
jgi:transglutaminase-like putative cysteine protease